MKSSLIVLLLAYAVLLAFSWANEAPLAEPRPGTGPGRVAVEILPQGDHGPVDLGLDADRARLSFLHWQTRRSGRRPPVVCLHGSPGSARNFEDLGPRLSASGWDVWAIDLPGFGRSAGPVGGHSIQAHARATLAALDALGIERFHVVAWSMGGGVAAHMADLEPERVASMSLIASIGVQEAEGSGSYAIEHVKYLALLGMVALVDRGTPHFGRFAGFTRAARAFALNFWETDQRPLRGILQRLAVPTFIAHGREDFLAAAWTAEESHRLIGTSRLATYDAGHFLPIAEPYGQLELLLVELEPFLERHDARGRTEPHEWVEAGGQPRGWRRLEPVAFAYPRHLPWWLSALVVTLGAFFLPFPAAILSGVFVASLQLDFGLAALAAVPGAGAQAWLGAPGSASAARRWLGTLLAPWRFVGWMLAVMVLAGLAAGLVAAGGGGGGGGGLGLPRAVGPLLAGGGLVVARSLLGRWWRSRVDPADQHDDEAA